MKTRNSKEKSSNKEIDTKEVQKEPKKPQKVVKKEQIESPLKKKTTPMKKSKEEDKKVEDKKLEEKPLMTKGTIRKPNKKAESTPKKESKKKIETKMAEESIERPQTTSTKARKVEEEVPKKRKSKEIQEPAPLKKKIVSDEITAKPKAIIIKPPEIPEIAIGGLSFDAKPKDIKELLASCGEINNITIPVKGLSIVKFNTIDQCKEAIKLSGSTHMGRVIKISMSKDIPNIRSEQINKNASVYVGNLSEKTDENSIKDFFKTLGPVKRIKIAINSQGVKKGFAFVEFYKLKSIHEAVELSGKSLDGKKLSIDYLAQKTKIKKSKSYKNEKTSKLKKIFKHK